LTPRGTVQWGHLKKPRIPAGASLSVLFQPFRSLLLASSSLDPREGSSPQPCQVEGFCKCPGESSFQFPYPLHQGWRILSCPHREFRSDLLQLAPYHSPKSLVLLCLLIVSDARRHREHVATHLPKTSPPTSDAVMTRQRTPACPTRTRPHAQHGSVRILPRSSHRRAAFLNCSKS
jgi:hypothetical protein